MIILHGSTKYLLLIEFCQPNKLSAADEQYGLKYFWSNKLTKACFIY